MLVIVCNSQSPFFGVGFFVTTNSIILHTMKVLWKFIAIVGVCIAIPIAVPGAILGVITGALHASHQMTKDNIQNPSLNKYREEERLRQEIAKSED